MVLNVSLNTYISTEEKAEFCRLLEHPPNIQRSKVSSNKEKRPRRSNHGGKRRIRREAMGGKYFKEAGKDWAKCH